MAEAAVKKAGWTRVAFGDVVRKVADCVDPETSGLERYVAGEHMDTDDLRIRRWGIIGDGYLGPAFHMRFKPGQVLYGSRRTYLRKVAVPHFEGICANTTFVLEPKDPNVLLPELLPFIMQTESFHEHSIKQSKGSVNPYVNFSDLEWYEFALPPLDEQRRIAEVLQSHERAMERLRELSIAAELVRRSHQSEFFLAHQSANVPLKEVVSIASGNTPSRANSEFWGGGLPWASGKDLKTRNLSTTQETLTDAGWKEAAIAPPGATLVVVRGMILAHTFPVAQCSAPVAFNQDLRALIPHSDLTPEYVTLWAEWAAPWFLARTSESSHGTKRLTASVFDEARVPLPERCVRDAFEEQQAQLLRSRDCANIRYENAKLLKQELLAHLVESRL